jgi:TRAP-type uncharacterized transport system fused permease subunit
MIPTIGLMIGAYILFRTLELLARYDKPNGKQWFVGICGILLFFFTAFCMISLLTSNVTMPNLPR